MKIRKTNRIWLVVTVVLLAALYGIPELMTRLKVRQLEKSMSRGQLVPAGSSADESAALLVLVFEFDRIEDAAVITFLEQTDSVDNLTMVLDLVGWRQRRSLLGKLEELKFRPEVHGRSVAVVRQTTLAALRHRLPFPGQDMPQEYYHGYSAQVVREITGLPESEIATVANRIALGVKRELERRSTR